MSEGGPRSQPGLHFRPLRQADLPALAALHRDRLTADGLDLQLPYQRPPSAADLAALFAPRPGFRPEHQLRVADMRGRVVGYAWTRAWAEDDGAWTLYLRCLVAPRWRGQGIEATLVRWAEEALGAAALGWPAGVPAQFRSDVYSTETALCETLAAEGYTVDQATVELALTSLDALPETPVPTGFRLRVPRPDELHAAFFAAHAALADEWGHVAPTDADFDDLMRSPDTDPRLWRLVLDGQRIAGVLLAEAHPPLGMITELGVGRTWRRRGLARALVAAGLQGFRERELVQARVYTDAANPFGARALYEAFGFQRAKDVRRYTKPAASAVK